MSKTLLAAAMILVSSAVAALEDPMRPPMAAPGVARGAAAARGGEAGLVLNSTFIARERRSAVINGERVEVGSRIGGAEVIEILPTQVRLRQGDKELTVRLLPVSVKTPATNEKQEQQ